MTLLERLVVVVDHLRQAQQDRVAQHAFSRHRSWTLFLLRQRLVDVRKLSVRLAKAKV